MANILIYDKTSKRALRYLKSVNTPEFKNRDDVLINPDIKGVDLAWSKVQDNKVINLTSEEKQAAINEFNLANYKELRKANYPKIGDQLDTILKQFKDFKAKGQELLPETDSLISEWEAVKLTYPKPI